MSTLRKRLDSLEQLIGFQQHMQLVRESQSRPNLETLFYAVHGLWAEKTIVTTQWADEDQKTCKSTE